MPSKSRSKKRVERRRTRKHRGGFISLFKPKTREQLQKEAEAVIAKLNPGNVKNNHIYLQNRIDVWKVKEFLDNIEYLKTISTTPSLPVSKANNNPQLYKTIRDKVYNFTYNYNIPMTPALLDTYTVADIDTFYQNMTQFTRYNERIQESQQIERNIGIKTIQEYATKLPDDTTTISKFVESQSKPGSMGSSLVLGDVNKSIKYIASAYNIPLPTSPINLTKPQLTQILSKIPS